MKKEKAIHNEIAMDLGFETRRVDQIMATIHSIQLRLDGVEQCTQTVSDNGTIRKSSITNPQSTITASGIPISDDEDLLLKANELIRTLGEEVFFKYTCDSLLKCICDSGNATAK